MAEPSMPDEPPVEARDIDAARVLKVAVAVLLVAVLTTAVCWQLLRWWQASRGVGPNLPPEVRLGATAAERSAPQPERAAYFAEKEKLLEGWQWLDRKAGIARIPIEAAMETLSSIPRGRGPAREDEPVFSSPFKGEVGRGMGQPVQGEGKELSLEPIPTPALPLKGRGEGLAREEVQSTQLPLQSSFVDESGRAVELRYYFRDRPVVLVPGYFECPNLCRTVMDGVLESLVQSAFPSGGYRLLAVSVDPREDAATARRKMDSYRPILAGEVQAYFLTGAEGGALSASLGFPASWDAEHAQYIHPAGFVVATPDGRISRVFHGVRFAPRDLRLALVEASAGRIGSVTDRLVLWCSHYDPATGRYSFAAMIAVRAAGVLTLFVMVLAMLWWGWRPRR